MENKQRGFISPLLMIIFVLVLIGGSFYLYSNHKKTNSTKATLVEPQELQEAKAAVKKETEKLEYLASRYDAELPIITQLQDNYSAIKESVLAKTDGIFSEPQTGELSANIKLSKKIETEINTRREEISNILNNWDNTISNINSVSQTESVPNLVVLVETAKNDLNTVSNYIKELETVVENLTPSNSGFTQQEINTYSQNITEVKEEVAKATETINSVAAQANNVITQTINSSQNENTNSVNNTETTSTNLPPVVTVSEIKAQEQAVAMAQSTQNQVEQSLATTTDTQTLTIPNVDYSVPDPFTNTGDTFVGTDKSNWPDLKPDDNSSRPSLLQGTN